MIYHLVHFQKKKIRKISEKIGLRNFFWNIEVAIVHNVVFVHYFQKYIQPKEKIAEAKSQTQKSREQADHFQAYHFKLII